MNEKTMESIMVRLHPEESAILDKYQGKHRSLKRATCFVDLLYKWDEAQNIGTSKDARLERIEGGAVALQANGARVEELLTLAIRKIDALEGQLDDLRNRVDALMVQNSDLVRRMGRAEDKLS